MDARVMVVGVIVANAIAIGLLVLVGAALPSLPLWSDRAPRPFACAACRVDYTDARALAWHVQGMHADTMCGVKGEARSARDEALRAAEAATRHEDNTKRPERAMEMNT